MQPATETILLLDGPISIAAGVSKRQRIVSDMAQALLAANTFRSERDSILSLVGLARWSSFDIAACIDDARQVAMQETVALMMSEDA